MRRENDAYYTPTWAVDILITHRPNIGRPDQVVVEPCVGDGAIAEPFRQRGTMVITNDLVPTINAHVNGDAKAAHVWRDIERVTRACGRTLAAIDWTVTNPPFIDAMEILKRAYDFSKRGVAMFLRLSFLEPTDDRGPWLAVHPPDELIIVPRISFTGDGKTDSVTCAWMIWHTGDTRPRPTSAYGPPIIIVPKVADAPGGLFGEEATT